METNLFHQLNLVQNNRVVGYASEAPFNALDQWWLMSIHNQILTKNYFFWVPNLEVVRKYRRE